MENKEKEFVKPIKGKRTPKKKRCEFCVEHISYIDYKDAPRLRKYMTESGKILPGRATGTCAHHQHLLATAIKRARYMALLPYRAE